MKVSVIMPSYNVKPFIRQCIESVIKQTLEDIEIICVDACSDDGTLEIIKEYAEKDKRIQIVKSEQRSYGYQLNLGFTCAKGEYIGIVETDDYISHDMYYELYHEAKKYDADFVKSDFDMFITTHDNTELSHRYCIPENTLFIHYDQRVSWRDYTESVFPPDVYIWNGIYKNSFIKENGIKLNETAGAAYQDCGFRYQVALSVESGYFINKSLYHYRRDNAGSSCFSGNGLRYDYNEMLYLLDMFKEKNSLMMEKRRYIARGMFHSFLFELRKGCRVLDHDSVYEMLALYRTKFKELYSMGFFRERDMEAMMWWFFSMLIEDADKFYMIQNEISKVEENQYLWMLNWARKDGIVLVGMGQYTKYAYTIITANDLEDKTILCDNNTTKQGEYRYGKEILNTTEVIEKNPKALYLITAKKSRHELCEWLIHRGVKRDNISTYVWPVHAGAITERRI